MRNDPASVDTEWGIPNFRPRKTFLSLAKAIFLLFRWPSLLGSVYTPTFFPHLRLSSAVLCEFGIDRARSMEALLRKTTKGKFFMCLSGEKSEECHAEKISNSMCR